MEHLEAVSPAAATATLAASSSAAAAEALLPPLAGAVRDADDVSLALFCAAMHA